MIRIGDQYYFRHTFRKMYKRGGHRIVFVDHSQKERVKTFRTRLGRNIYFLIKTVL